MRVTVLGSAAGGGFPQWNCACSNCSRLRAGKIRSRPRSQAQVVVCAHAHACYLINASPDLRTQILSSPSLNPAASLRDTPIAGIVLTSADVDSVAGLLHLREFQPLRIVATPSVRRIVLEENRIFRVLNRANPPAIWKDLPTNESYPLAFKDSSAQEPMVLCRAISLGGAYPDYVSENLRKSLPPDEAVIGLLLEEGSRQVFFAPTIPPGANDWWREVAAASDLCLLDGTFWSDDELIAAGASRKTAREIGHVPLSGPGGMLEKFRPSTGVRQVLVHINNTNPILDEDSPEFRNVTDAGWEVAYDGMEFDL